MIAFQVDENFRDKEFAKACRAQGMADVTCFPPEMRGADDEDVLHHFMALDKPLLTNDINIAADHEPSVPARHPGIIIVCYSDQNPRTATMAGLRKIISDFKKSFPKWHNSTCSNSILQITELDVIVWHMHDGSLRKDSYIPFSKSGWQEELELLLIENSSRALLD
jgi:hypothetical protein